MAKKPSEVSLKLFCVTLTGADDLTPPRDLARVQKEFPFVEWGILIYPDRPNQAGSARYPSLGWIDRFLEEVPHGHKALHVCGAAVPKLLDGDAEMVNLAK